MVADADILTNDFVLRYDEGREVLQIFTVSNGRETRFPIELRLATLSEMGSDKASKWLGETLLLLIPAMRINLFGLEGSN